MFGFQILWVRFHERSTFPFTEITASERVVHSLAKLDMHLYSIDTLRLGYYV